MFPECSLNQVSLPMASAQDTCTATLELEITIPKGSTTNQPTPPNFGLTDHYLEANSSTVRWGVFDLSAPAMLTMKSGETVTVEVRPPPDRFKTPSKPPKTGATFTCSPGSHHGEIVTLEGKPPLSPLRPPLAGLVKSLLQCVPLTTPSRPPPYRLQTDLPKSHRRR